MRDLLDAVWSVPDDLGDPLNDSSGKIPDPNLPCTYLALAYQISDVLCDFQQYSHCLHQTLFAFYMTTKHYRIDRCRLCAQTSSPTLMQERSR